MKRREFIATVALGAVGAIRSLGAVGPTGAQPRPRLKLNASGLGATVEVESPDGRRIIGLESSIEGFAPLGVPVVSTAVDGAVSIRRTWISGGARRCEVIDQFTPAKEGELGWSVEIRSSGPPMTAPVHLIARYPATPRSRFWTAWSDPSEIQGSLPRERMVHWVDPLRPMPFSRRHFFYGAPPYTHDDPVVSFSPCYRELLALPLASFLEPGADSGASLILSPDAGDGFLDLSLTTGRDGTADFALSNHRFSSDRPLRFGAHLVAHEGDWRGGLRWMTRRYPRYFEPALGLADQLDGTAAYSSDEKVDVDVEKLKRMAFRVNWKASFDFPYMGMFLPPVGEASWGRYVTDASGFRIPGVTQLTSVREMAGYSEKMRSLGFYVLNYFNVTEFGAGIHYPPPPRTEKDPARLWENADDFLYGNLPGAILHVPSGISESVLKVDPKLKVGGPFYTWGDGISMDCGEQEYARFLLGQALKHIEKLPASSGICIDRMDWLRFYNEDRDDGVTWFAGRPARSLYNSWRGLMEKLLPLFHQAGKVVFVNNHTKRFDLLRDIDGIYDEFAVNGAALNLTALLSVSRPALGWTNDEAAIRPDPDGFFQRFLYLGVFPTAPFPGNDHAIAPSAWADRQYLDYGPLMNAIHGRKWVLEPHAVAVEGGVALANLFSVSGGFAMPVMLGGGEKHARVSVAALPGMEAFTADAVVPGAVESAPVSWEAEGDRLVFEVPLVRGCALVRIRTRG